MIIGDGHMNTKKNISIFLVVLFIVTFFSCLYFYTESEEEYYDAEMNVILERTDKLMRNIFDHDPDVDTSEFDAVKNKRAFLVAGMIGSAIGTIICGIILIGALTENSNTTKITNNKSTHSDTAMVKIEQLKAMLDHNFITEQEYQDKKQEILNKM